MQPSSSSSSAVPPDDTMTDTLELDEDHVELTLDDAIEILEEEEDGNGMAEDFSDDDDEPDANAAPSSSRKRARKDTSTVHFAGHSAAAKSAVFCLATHPNPAANIAVSGGEDDLAYIWRTDDGQEVARLTGHTDSVSCVGWSADGELVATGGMDGKVRIWRRVKPNPSSAPGSEWARWEFLTNLEGPDDVTVRTFEAVHLYLVPN